MSLDVVLQNNQVYLSRRLKSTTEKTVMITTEGTTHSSDNESIPLNAPEEIVLSAMLLKFLLK